MTHSIIVRCLVLASAIAWSAPARAQVDARMFQQPAVSATEIAFVYAGDIWVVPRQGGLAVRLSSPPGVESFPRFSPDGSRVAYTAAYDGVDSVYVVPTHGGDPVRLTHHPMGDRVVGWHPDGKRVLFVSSRESGRQRYSQFFLVPVTGGLPEKLAVPYGEFGTFSPDGMRFAYMPQSQDFRTWKRYRGGWAPDIWTFDLATLASANVTTSDAVDSQPMWHGRTLYFLSDRGPEMRQNLWARDEAAGTIRRVTEFKDYDITFPSIGPGNIVFQAGGRLYLLDLATEKFVEVLVRVTTDRMTLRPRTAKVAPLIAGATVSPSAKRAVFEARGDVFSVPAEHGPVVNLTRSSGVAERLPRWSPDGRTIAYWSDRSGEYELAVRAADGAGEERTVTSLGPGFRYGVSWSPDSRSVVYIDQAMRVRLTDIASGKTTEVDRSPAWLSDGDLHGFHAAWSADSRYVAWTRAVGTENDAVFVYDTRDASLHQVTSGYYGDASPTFDPEGKYLFYASDRSFDPVYGTFDNSWTYANATRLVALPLRKDVASPLAARNDAEGDDGDDAKKGGEKKADDAKKGDVASQAADAVKGTADKKDGDRKDGDKKDEAPVAVTIDFDGLEARAVVLPPAPGNFGRVEAVKGKLLFHRRPRTGSSDKESPVVAYDLKEREEKTLIADVEGFAASRDGSKLFVAKAKKYGVIDAKPDQKLEKTMRIDEMEALVDPKAEWKQIFADAYRFERDYFYDPNMHGVEWAKTRAQYAKLVDDAVTRWDVNFVLGEFIGELNASHTYRGGGDEEQVATRGIGMLGVDWEVDRGAYRIKRIVRGGPWDSDARSPLAEPGVNVKEGEYVLAVNGVPLDVARDPWAAFDGLAGAAVQLTVNDAPSPKDARQVVVTCLGDETELRFRAWIEERRARVEAASNGRIGYIYAQSTGTDAQNELVRQFVAMRAKDGLIVDERFNSGGQIPDRFVELLNRPPLAYWAVRDAKSVRWPQVAHRGPKAMLINGWSGSGGDAFPYYFRAAGLGPLIGTRTWGGLIGISGVPELVDGGVVTVPTFRMFDPKGTWFAEGHGVDPDIAVGEDPTALAKGIDPQLERAIEEVAKALRGFAVAPERPAYEKRTPW